MKNDVFSQDNQNVGNDISTNNNLDMGGGNNTNDLSANNLVNNNIGTESINSTDNLTNDMNNTPPMMNSEVIGAVGNENITNINSSEVLPTDNNVNNNNSHKKLFIIIGIIVGVIILVIIAIFVYIKVGFTASKYIDDKVEEITTFVDEIFMTNNYNADADTIMNGEFSVNSSVSELAMLNGLKVNFEVGTSLAKEIVDINLGLANEESKYTANLYINNNRMYLDSTDIYSTPIYMDLEDSPFANINVEELNFENYKNAIVNLIKYLGLALKESDMSSSIKGLSAVYRYEINDSNKEAFAQKMNELIEQDTNMLDFLEMLGITDANVSAENLSDMVFEVTVSIPSGDLKGFTLTIDGSVMRLEETAKDNYDLLIDDEVVLKVTVDGDNVNLVNADANNGTFDIIINTKDYTLSAKVETTEYTMSMDIENESDKVKNIGMEISANDSTTDVNMVVDLIVTKVSNSEIETKGNVVIGSNGENINLDFTLNSENGNNLVEEKNFADAKDMNALTTAEENEISTNLMTILSDIVPEVTETVGLQQFLMSAQVYASTASVAIMPGSCTTFEELGFGTDMVGKIETDALGGYTISITDGEYMILNKYVYNSATLSADDVEVYDASRFTEEYYTCLAS